MQVFVVEMLRWGERELHSYVKGIYDTQEKAEAAAVEEEENRAGKYIAEITGFILNKGRNEISILKRSTGKSWWDPIPEDRILKVGDLVKSIEGEIGKVVEVSKKSLGRASALVEYSESKTSYHDFENLEKQAE